MRCIGEFRKKHDETIIPKGSIGFRGHNPLLTSESTVESPLLQRTRVVSEIHTSE